jgi:tetratricopeptide (TPR) repeat protein
MRGLIVAIILAAALPGTRAHATEAQDQKARELYAEGQAQFRQEHYQTAYDLFKQAYLLSPLPELRYNMASALQGLGRPHDAAEELRAYLRLKPDDSEKANLEARIQGLEEAQRLLDAGKPTAPAPVVAPVSVVAPAPAPPPREGWTRKKTLITVLSTVGAVVVAGGLGIGLGLGLHDWHTDSTLGTRQATP